MVPTKQQIAKYLEQEQLALKQVKSIVTMKAFLSRKDCLLRDEHYAFFNPVDDEVASLFERGVDPLPSILYLVGCVERLLPEFHASRATFYEMFAVFIFFLLLVGC